MAMVSAIGGGLRDLNIFNGKPGGRAIYMRARTAAFRPTSFKFENVVVLADGEHNRWDGIMELDGRDVGPEDGAGIRNVDVVGLRGAQAVGGGDRPYIWLRQVVNFKAVNLALDRGKQEKNALIRVSNLSDTILLSNLKADGLWYDYTIERDAAVVEETIGLKWICQSTVSGILTSGLWVSSKNVTGAAAVALGLIPGGGCYLAPSCGFSVFGSLHNRPYLNLGGDVRG